MSQDWDIKPRGKVCFDCQAPFIDRQVYYARLLFNREGYDRGDFCETCWSRQGQSLPRHSSWKGVFRVPPVEPDRTVRRETAEALLRDLIRRETPDAVNVIYILCVMLERQRLLVEREVRTAEDGEKRVVYEHRKTGESFVIVDPQLKLTDLEHVQQEVLALLTATPSDSGSQPPEDAAPAPEQTAASVEPANQETMRVS